MKRAWVCAALLIFAVAVHAERRRALTPRTFHDITIGALFSLTGDGATLGQASNAALDLARRDINAELATMAFS